MRKRIVIGVLAIIAVGVLVYVFSQPKPGTIEWHKKKYLAGCKESRGLMWKAKQLWGERVRGRYATYHFVDTFDSYYTFDFDPHPHQQALIDFGYLERREFMLSNRPVWEVQYEASRLFRMHPKRALFQERFLDVGRRGTNVMIIVAIPNDMPVVDEIIRKADVP